MSLSPDSPSVERVLRELSIAERTGMQLVELVPGLRRGTVYVHLARMVEAGLIESHASKMEMHAPGLLAVRVYRLTDVGREHVRQMHARGTYR